MVNPTPKPRPRPQPPLPPLSDVPPSEEVNQIAARVNVVPIVQALINFYQGFDRYKEFRDDLIQILESARDAIVQRGIGNARQVPRPPKVRP